jgi:Zn-dependent hydrolases, including glyoxylases
MATVKNAVQPDEWYAPLPREQYKLYEQLPAVSDWFEIYKLPKNIYAIYEPHHFQEVISFLVIGEEKALLIDTGLGFKDIKDEVDALTTLPIIVVNTHSHFDHVGSNWQFDKVFIINEPNALQRLKNGVNRRGETTGEIDTNFEPEAFHYHNGEIPIDLATFKGKPSVPQPIENGYVFDLGGRKFEVVHTPGHSPDSIMLANHEEKILFTGDSFYPASLYAHIQKSDGLNSEKDVYRSTISKVAGMFADYDLYCSHNEPICPGSMLVACAKAFDDIEAGTVDYIEDESGLKKYQFDGFAIITK